TVTIVTNSNVVCPGAAATLTANGASTYSWVSGPGNPQFTVSPLVTSIYTVTGFSANGCGNTKTVMISVFEPTLNVTSTPSICAGSNATLIASGADTYLWDNNVTANLQVVTPSVTTNYTVTATT